MEILTETVHQVDYLLALISSFILALVFLSVAGGITYDSFKNKDFDVSTVMGIICTGFIGIGLSIIFFIGVFKNEADTTYKATVSNFNEVYDQGYKIVGQEGKIFILEKQD